ncbi:MAG: TonB-dependent receptor, partial [Acidobacteria bacterium]|nr:TonB-dependent receptor [Acidobacteriota bacterium]
MDLPLNGRNFLQLALLSAGAAPLAMSGSDVSNSFRPSLNISGGRESSNQFTIDGVFNNAVHFEGLNLQLSVDAIQEFKVQRNTFSAEFGQGTAIVNVASKSGSNNFHGTIFEFLRNDVLDARQFFDAEVPPFRQNQFGFSFGGPIIKDKTFFFTNYEGFRRRRANTFVATLPVARQLSGDFTGANPVRDPLTGQPFPNNIIPQNRISPLSNRIIAFLPKPSTGGANNFLTTRTERSDFDQFTARIDHRIGARDHVFVRYTISDIELFAPGLIELSGSTTKDKPQNVGVQWTHTISPILVNEARAGFNRNLLDRLQEGAGGEDILKFQNILS